MNPPNSNGDPLEARLRADAARIAAPEPEGMDRRIMRAVRQPERPGEEVRRPFAWLPLAMAGAAAALMLAALVIRLPHAGAPSSDAGVAAADEAQLVSAVKSMPVQVWTSLQTKAGALLEDDPLRADAKDLYSDARSAANFLALNFLPSAPAKPRPTPPGEG